MTTMLRGFTLYATGDNVSLAARLLRLAAVACTAGALSALPASAGAQQSGKHVEAPMQRKINDDQLGAEQAVARAFRKTFKGKITFDPMVYRDGKWIAKRSARHAAEVAHTLGGDVQSARQVVHCSGTTTGSRKCLLDGTPRVVVAIDIPAIKGDRAVVRAIAWRPAVSSGGVIKQSYDFGLTRRGNDWHITSNRKKARSR